MSSGPRISVILPAYNAERYLDQAVRSVQAQTMVEWELLIIDDASTDQTFRMASDLAKTDTRIHVYQNKTNRGVAYTRNRGISLAKGECLAFLDADDQWRPEKLERQQLQLLSDQLTELVYSSYSIVDGNGSACCEDYLVPPRIDYTGLLRENVIGCSTVMIRHSALDGFSFPERYYHEDYALWLMLLKAGRRAVGLPEILVDYRMHPGGRAANKLKSAGHRWKIYRSLVGLSLPQSVFYSLRYVLGGLHKYRRLRRKGKDA